MAQDTIACRLQNSSHARTHARTRASTKTHADTQHILFSPSYSLYLQFLDAGLKLIFARHDRFFLRFLVLVKTVDFALHSCTHGLRVCVCVCKLTCVHKYEQASERACVRACDHAVPLPYAHEANMCKHTDEMNKFHTAA
jgi:hypothetical protein